VHYNPDDSSPHSSAFAPYFECQGVAALAQAARNAEVEWVGSKKAQRETETAVHEAGHAVAAALLGRPIEHVNIIPDGDVLGTCCYKHEPGPYDAELIERDLIITYAGETAAEAYVGLLRPIGLGPGDGSYAANLFMWWDDVVGLDLPEQLRHWTDNYEPTDEEYDLLIEFEWLQRAKHEQVFLRRTKTLVRENWPKIEAVAAALLKERKISGERVMQIVERAQEPLMAA
jgi:hypothetical protein